MKCNLTFFKPASHSPVELSEINTLICIAWVLSRLLRERHQSLS